jgi:hypothetical protein
MNCKKSTILLRKRKRKKNIRRINAKKRAIKNQQKFVTSIA